MTSVVSEVLGQEEQQIWSMIMVKFLIQTEKWKIIQKDLEMLGNKLDWNLEKLIVHNNQLNPLG
jgi:hypothetical protein